MFMIRKTSTFGKNFQKKQKMIFTNHSNHKKNFFCISLNACSLALFLSILLDLTFIIVFFLDGHSNVTAFFKQQFDHYSLKSSIADLFVCMIESYLSFC